MDKRTGVCLSAVGRSFEESRTESVFYFDVDATELKYMYLYRSEGN